MCKATSEPSDLGILIHQALDRFVGGGILHGHVVPKPFVTRVNASIEGLKKPDPACEARLGWYEFIKRQRGLKLRLVRPTLRYLLLRSLPPDGSVSRGLGHRQQ